MLGSDERSKSACRNLQTTRQLKHLGYPCNRSWRPIDLWGIEGPTYFLDNRPTDGSQSGCQPYVSAAFYPPGRFLVLVSVRGWVDSRAIVSLEVLGQFKKSSYLIGNRTCGIPACIWVPQPTTLPRTSGVCGRTILHSLLQKCCAILKSGLNLISVCSSISEPASTMKAEVSLRYDEERHFINSLNYVAAYVVTYYFHWRYAIA
jgi:hypothetical protein